MCVLVLGGVLLRCVSQRPEILWRSLSKISHKFLTWHDTSSKWKYHFLLKYLSIISHNLHFHLDEINENIFSPHEPGRQMFEQVPHSSSASSSGTLPFCSCGKLWKTFNAAVQNEYTMFLQKKSSSCSQVNIMGLGFCCCQFGGAKRGSKTSHQYMRKTLGEPKWMMN